MISTLTLRFGRTPSAVPEPISVTPVTVFVGPNNSGKSRLLAEIHQYCSSGQENAASLLLKELGFRGMSNAAAEAALEYMRQAPRLGEAVSPDHVLIGKRGDRMQVGFGNFRQALLAPTNHPTWFAGWYLRLNTLMIDGPSRIGLVAQQPAGDLQQPPHSSLQVLFGDDAKRAEVRRIIFEAFQSYFVIDPTQLGQLRIRLSDVPPSTVREERGIDNEAVRFHARAQPIDVGSDGVKAFTGIITEVIAGDPQVVLIDEPEAFLHPALAYKLGNETARASLAADKRLFVATHSPSFVMGCLQSGAPVNIVRLTYRGGVATARLLPSAEILRLMRNPLLRSTGVLSGLFYEFVIVTESDADRAFYQEVNERLLRFRPDWGIPNALFLNAQNKQTVQTIVGPLRELGIPTVAIVDIDVLKEGGSVWSSLLRSANVPPLIHQPLGTIRAAVKGLFDAAGKDMKKDGGVAVLNASGAEAANNLFDQLGEYGVFVVRGGEVESWLKSLGAPGHGPPWLIDVFEKMGEDPDAAGYVKPGDGDVWEFLRGVRTWLVAPGRKGIPA